MGSAKEGEPCNTKPGIDLVSAVNEFHKLSSRDLSRLIGEAENGTIRYPKEHGSLLEINMETLVKNLAIHLISKLLSLRRDEEHIRYLLAGLRLLHGFYDLASNHHPKLEDFLYEDVNSFDRLVDMTFFTIIFVSNFKQKLYYPIVSSSLLPGSLYLLKLSISSEWDEVAKVLMIHPKVDVFASIVFPAVRVFIGFLQEKLTADILSNVYEITRVSMNCEASLQFLHSLCQQKVFRERLVKNKVLCQESGVVWLFHDIMKLPLCEEFRLMLPISRLKSKILSIMLQICEIESFSFLDLAASTTEGLDLAKSTVFEVLEMLRIMFCGNVNGVSGYNPGITQLKAMRLTEILSHDSNFRSYIVSNFTEVLTRVLLLPHEEFVSIWCSTDSDPVQEDVFLDYDSFLAAGQILGVMSAPLLSNPIFFTPRASETPFAHQKTSLLVKIIANLACFGPDVSKEERGLFLKKFFRCLQKGLSNLPDGGASERADAASRNLCSLMVRAESLTPEFLTKDDVSLFRFFISQLKKLIITSQQSIISRAKEAHNRVKGASAAPQRSTPDGWNRKERAVDESDGYSTKIETIGSYLSDIRLNTPSDRMNNNVEEEDMFTGVQSEEQQLKKRKRKVMNDVQIEMIEKALKDEPNMQRRAASVQLWADKLSLHGSEVTSTQLKNWLNNRRAKLARAAAKQGPVCESPPESPSDDQLYEPPPSVLRICGIESARVPKITTTTGCFRRELGQKVVLVDGRGEEIGKGSIHMARGIWFDIHLQNSGVCVVDVTDLKVDETTELPHPCDATGFSFQEAQMILGRKRILWDSAKLLLIQT